jgi:threonine aldolase
MVALENTHNRAGGSIYELEELKRIREAARAKNLIVHLDGARIWNAAAATGCREANIAQYADSVSVCFSKGLGAPVGSAVAGSREFVGRAHRYRKLFGGGMRQVGILAAAALYALENHRERLVEDHAKAVQLTKLLLEDGRVTVDQPVQTNILMATLSETTVSAPELARRCARDGVLFFPEGERRLRLVTHLDVPAAAIAPAADIIRKHLTP